MTIPGVPITTVPNEGDSTYPSLVAIKTTESVGPSVANRQPIQLRTRDLTLRDRVNKLIDALTFIGQGAAGTTDYYLPRDGTLAMLADLDMNDNRVDDIKRITMTAVGSGGEGIFAGSNRIQDVADPTAAQDAATRAYVLAQVGGGSVDKQRYWPVQDFCEASGSGGGLQRGTVAIAKPGTVLGSNNPPLYVDLALVIYNAANYTTAVDRLVMRVYKQLDASNNLSWYTRFAPPVAGYYPNWRYGTSGNVIELPTFYWSRASTRNTSNFGVYTHQTTAHALASPPSFISQDTTPQDPTTSVFFREDSTGTSNEVAVQFSWNDATQTLTVAIDTDVSGIVCDVTCVWDDLNP